MQNEKEIWKPVNEFVGIYEVSNHGRIRRNRNGKVHILAQAADGNRKTVGLYKNNKEYRRKVHRVVLEAFLGKCPDGMESCHNDDNGHNNHISNLRWDTHINNCRDRKRNGKEKSLFAKDNCNHAKINMEDARNIRAIGRTATLKEIAKKYPIGATQVSNILLGYSWKDPNWRRGAGK